MFAAQFLKAIAREQNDGVFLAFREFHHRPAPRGSRGIGVSQAPPRMCLAWPGRRRCARRGNESAVIRPIPAVAPGLSRSDRAVFPVRSTLFAPLERTFRDRRSQDLSLL